MNKLEKRLIKIKTFLKKITSEIDKAGNIALYNLDIFESNFEDLKECEKQVRKIINFLESIKIYHHIAKDYRKFCIEDLLDKEINN